MYNIIKTYLLTHSELAIHGMGNWKVEYQPSQLHPVLRTFTVPGYYVNLTVNEDVETTSDFIAYAMQEWQADEKETQQRIDAFVGEVKATLAQGKTYTFGSIGQFINNGIGKMEFEPMLDPDFSPESFGMENFEIPQSKTDTQTDSPKEHLAADTNKALENKGKKSHYLSALLIILAILTLLVLLMGVLYIQSPQTILKYKQKIERTIERILPSSHQEEEELLPSIFAETGSESNISDEPSMVDENFIENTTVYISDNHDDISKQTAQETQNLQLEPVSQYQTVQTINTELSASSAQTDKIASNKENQINAAQKAGESTSKDNASEKVKADATASTEGYYIVLGSFKSESNAESFLKNKSGQYADICHLGQGKSSNLYMVGIGPYSQQEAQQKIVNEGIKGWILKK
ncbi:MAG: SPOR domain-containing protein [Bacteroidales bacterium]|nr:SPOR domain-containing protein [Bacteroidales bacterium]